MGRHAAISSGATLTPRKHPVLRLGTRDDVGYEIKGGFAYLFYLSVCLLFTNVVHTWALFEAHRLSSRGDRVGCSVYVARRFCMRPDDTAGVLELAS